MANLLLGDMHWHFFGLHSMPGESNHFRWYCSDRFHHIIPMTCSNVPNYTSNFFSLLKHTSNTPLHKCLIMWKCLQCDFILLLYHIEPSWVQYHYNMVNFLQITQNIPPHSLPARPVNAVSFVWSMVHHCHWWASCRCHVILHSGMSRFPSYCNNLLMDNTSHTLKIKLKINLKI